MRQTLLNAQLLKDCQCTQFWLTLCSMSWWSVGYANLNARPSCYLQMSWTCWPLSTWASSPLICCSGLLIPFCKRVLHVAGANIFIRNFTGFYTSLLICRNSSFYQRVGYKSESTNVWSGILLQFPTQQFLKDLYWLKWSVMTLLPFKTHWCSKKARVYWRTPRWRRKWRRCLSLWGKMSLKIATAAPLLCYTLLDSVTNAMSSWWEAHLR